MEEKGKSIFTIEYRHKIGNRTRGKTNEEIYGSKKCAKKIIKQREKDRLQTLKDNPKIMKNIVKKRNQTYKDNPKIVENLVKKRNQTYKDNPKIVENAIKKRAQTYKNNLEINKNAHKKLSATQQGIELKDWKKFISREPYDQRFNNIFKRRIRKRDNQICMKCGIHKEKLNRALAIHHINYDKQMSIKENCCTVCGKCNAEVNTNRKHWTKFFQSLLGEKYGYQYTENNEIILEIKNEQ